MVSLSRSRGRHSFLGGGAAYPIVPFLISLILYFLQSGDPPSTLLNGLCLFLFLRSINHSLQTISFIHSVLLSLLFIVCLPCLGHGHSKYLRMSDAWYILANNRCRITHGQESVLKIGDGSLPLEFPACKIGEMP